MCIKILSQGVFFEISQIFRLKTYEKPDLNNQKSRRRIDTIDGLSGAGSNHSEKFS